MAIGHVQLSNIKKLPQEYDGRGMAIAGLATGYVAIGFVVLSLIIVLATGAAVLGSL